MKRILMVVTIISVIFFGGIYLKSQRVEGIMLDENKIEWISPIESCIDQISGLINYWYVYQDIKIEDWKDLEEQSSYIVNVTVSEVSQIEDAIFTKARVNSIVKDESQSIEITDDITFLQPNYLYYDSGNFIVNMISPIMTTKVGQQYVLYLNKILDYGDVYRPSTLCYSIVPVKNQINEMFISERRYIDDTVEWSRTVLEYSYFKDVDYFVATGQKYWMDNNDIENNTEEGKEILQRALELERKYVERYHNICTDTLRNYDIVPTFVRREYPIDELIIK